MDKNIKDNLDEVIKIMRSNESYPKYKEARDNISESDELKTLLRTYKDMSLKLQKRAIEGLEPDEEDVKKFTSISLLAFDNEDIVNYINSEIAIQNKLSDIIRYICKELDIEI